MRSLRLRLSLAAAGLIVLALALAGAGLTLIFDRVLDARTAEDLDRTAKFLGGQVGIAPDGSLTLQREPPDPRFATPYGGLYWQVAADGRSLRSRSLWDKALGPTPAAAEPGRPWVGDLPGPDGGRLVAAARRIEIEVRGAAVPVSAVVAEDRRDLAASRATYLRLLVPSLAALGLVLTLAMWVFVHRALGPFRTLRAELGAVHAGRRTRLPEHFPEEVQPLVDDLNRLIAAQARSLQRARARAGDMAHGLKTPLAVLAALARRTQAAEPGLAAEIEAQALAMGRQVERTLARARIVAGGDLRRRGCRVAPVVDRLVATMRRLPEGDSLAWEVAVPDALAYPGEEGDLTELLGNLLDNARKWAHRRVAVTGAVTASGSVLRIADDGPGMSATAIGQIARGRRWDETKPGTGFGIAIARDIAEETGATLHFSRSEAEGLRVDIAWTARA
ncbi:ATP-binding protein [uncultured Methylobacterium sp.]|uniref:ATP-binding protein n=1 Tax=uncultured Methylobacterium sp. TaxID=157278 RepID=UPI0035CBCB9D